MIASGVHFNSEAVMHDKETSIIKINFISSANYTHGLTIPLEIFCLRSYNSFMCSKIFLVAILNCAPIIDYIHENLPNYGVLKQSDGFVYVDLDDEYVHSLISFIEEEGFQEPPYFGDSTLVGAHITVIYPHEMTGANQIKECGEVIEFTPQQCQVVHPPRWKKVDEVYFITVDCPQLDKIRERYHLPKREYPFHITIGIK